LLLFSAWDSVFVFPFVVEEESVAAVVSDVAGAVGFGGGAPNGVWIVGFEDGASGGWTKTP